LAFGAALVLIWYFRHLIQGYAGKVGEIKAQKEQLDEILRQLGATTRLSEDIKAEVSQKDWRERERLTLYRSRLEELLTTAYSVSEEAYRLVSSAINEERIFQNQAPGNRLKTIAAFYFPELKVAVCNAVTLGSKVGGAAIQLNSKRRLSYMKLEAAQTVEAKDAIVEEVAAICSALTTDMQDRYKELVLAVNVLEATAVPLIAQYLP
jgi:hypothetical protein